MITPPPLSTTRRLKRIAPFQLGKLLAIIYGILGLFFIPFLLAGALASSQLPEEQRSGLMAMGVGVAVLAPVIYAVMGFLIGVLGAALYNLVAKWVGGIEVEVE